MTQRSVRETAAYHATHLPPIDYGYILGDETAFGIELAKTCHFLSPSTSERSKCSTLYSLLRQILVELSQNTVYLDIVGGATVQTFLKHNRLVELIILGPGLHDSEKARALLENKRSFGPQELLTKTVSNAVYQDTDGIAIVGMGGRFPGADDLDQYWDVIRTAKDLHEKVRNPTRSMKEP